MLMNTLPRLLLISGRLGAVSSKHALSLDTTCFSYDIPLYSGPCRMISPIFEELAQEYPGIRFYKVDVDDVAVSIDIIGV